MIVCVPCWLQVVADLRWGSASVQEPQSLSAAPAAQQRRDVAFSNPVPSPRPDAYPIAATSDNVGRAVAALQEGQVIAVPTETLYGLAADANSAQGVQQIYAIKQRGQHLPLAICLAEPQHIQVICLMLDVL